jgi:hypothetical protein
MKPGRLHFIFFLCLFASYFSAPSLADDTSSHAGVVRSSDELDPAKLSKQLNFNDLPSDASEAVKFINHKQIFFLRALEILDQLRHQYSDPTTRAEALTRLSEFNRSFHPGATVDNFIKTEREIHQALEKDFLAGVSKAIKAGVNPIKLAPGALRLLDEIRGESGLNAGNFLTKKLEEELKGENMSPSIRGLLDRRVKGHALEPWEEDRLREWASNLALRTDHNDVFDETLALVAQSLDGRAGIFENHDPEAGTKALAYYRRMRELEKTMSEGFSAIPDIQGSKDPREIHRVSEAMEKNYILFRDWLSFWEKERLTRTEILKKFGKYFELKTGEQLLKKYEDGWTDHQVEEALLKLSAEDYRRHFADALSRLGGNLKDPAMAVAAAKHFSPEVLEMADRVLIAQGSPTRFSFFLPYLKETLAQLKTKNAAVDAALAQIEKGGIASLFDGGPASADHSTKLEQWLTAELAKKNLSGAQEKTLLLFKNLLKRAQNPVVAMNKPTIVRMLVGVDNAVPGAPTNPLVGPLPGQTLRPISLAPDAKAKNVEAMTQNRDLVLSELRNLEEIDESPAKQRENLEKLKKGFGFYYQDRTGVPLPNRSAKELKQEISDLLLKDYAKAMKQAQAAGLTHKDLPLTTLTLADQAEQTPHYALSLPPIRDQLKAAGLNNPDLEQGKSWPPSKDQARRLLGWVHDQSLRPNLPPALHALKNILEDELQGHARKQSLARLTDPGSADPFHFFCHPSEPPSALGIENSDGGCPEIKTHSPEESLKVNNSNDPYYQLKTGGDLKDLLHNRDAVYRRFLLIQSTNLTGTTSPQATHWVNASAAYERKTLQEFLAQFKRWRHGKTAREVLSLPADLLLLVDRANRLTNHKEENYFIPKVASVLSRAEGPDAKALRSLVCQNYEGGLPPTLSEIRAMEPLAEKVKGSAKGPGAQEIVDTTNLLASLAGDEWKPLELTPESSASLLQENNRRYVAACLRNASKAVAQANPVKTSEKDWDHLAGDSSPFQEILPTQTRAEAIKTLEHNRELVKEGFEKVSDPNLSYPDYEKRFGRFADRGISPSPETWEQTRAGFVEKTKEALIGQSEADLQRVLNRSDAKQIEHSMSPQTFAQGLALNIFKTAEPLAQRFDARVEKLASSHGPTANWIRHLLVTRYGTSVPAKATSFETVIHDLESKDPSIASKTRRWLAAHFDDIDRHDAELGSLVAAVLSSSDHGQKAIGRPEAFDPRPYDLAEAKAHIRAENRLMKESPERVELVNQLEGFLGGKSQKNPGPLPNSARHWILESLREPEALKNVAQTLRILDPYHLAELLHAPSDVRDQKLEEYSRLYGKFAPHLPGESEQDFRKRAGEAYKFVATSRLTRGDLARIFETYSAQRAKITLADEWAAKGADLNEHPNADELARLKKYLYEDSQGLARYLRPPLDLSSMSVQAEVEGGTALTITPEQVVAALQSAEASWGLSTLTTFHQIPTMEAEDLAKVAQSLFRGKGATLDVSRAEVLKAMAQTMTTLETKKLAPGNPQFASTMHAELTRHLGTLSKDALGEFGGSIEEALGAKPTNEEAKLLLALKELKGKPKTAATIEQALKKADAYSPARASELTDLLQLADSPNPQETAAALSHEQKSEHKAVADLVIAVRDLNKLKKETLAKHQRSLSPTEIEAEVARHVGATDAKRWAKVMEEATWKSPEQWAAALDSAEKTHKGIVFQEKVFSPVEWERLRRALELLRLGSLFGDQSAKKGKTSPQKDYLHEWLASIERQRHDYILHSQGGYGRSAQILAKTQELLEEILGEQPRLGDKPPEPLKKPDKEQVMVRLLDKTNGHDINTDFSSYIDAALKADRPSQSYWWVNPVPLDVRRGYLDAEAAKKAQAQKAPEVGVWGFLFGGQSRANDVAAKYAEPVFKDVRAAPGSLEQVQALKALRRVALAHYQRSRQGLPTQFDGEIAAHSPDKGEGRRRLQLVLANLVRSIDHALASGTKDADFDATNYADSPHGRLDEYMKALDEEIKKEPFAPEIMKDGVYGTHEMERAIAKQIIDEPRNFHQFDHFDQREQVDSELADDQKFIAYVERLFALEPTLHMAVPRESRAKLLKLTPPLRRMLMDVLNSAVWSEKRKEIEKLRAQNAPAGEIAKAEAEQKKLIHQAADLALDPNPMSILAAFQPQPHLWNEFLDSVEKDLLVWNEGPAEARKKIKAVLDKARNLSGHINDETLRSQLLSALTETVKKENSSEPQKRLSQGLAVVLNALDDHGHMQMALKDKEYRDQYDSNFEGEKGYDRFNPEAVVGAHERFRKEAAKAGCPDGPVAQWQGPLPLACDRLGKYLMSKGHSDYGISELARSQLLDPALTADHFAMLARLDEILPLVRHQGDAKAPLQALMQLHAAPRADFIEEVSMAYDPKYRAYLRYTKSRDELMGTVIGRLVAAAQKGKVNAEDDSGHLFTDLACASGAEGHTILETSLDGEDKDIPEKIQDLANLEAFRRAIERGRAGQEGKPHPLSKEEIQRIHKQESPIVLVEMQRELREAAAARLIEESTKGKTKEEVAALGLYDSEKGLGCKVRGILGPAVRGELRHIKRYGIDQEVLDNEKEKIGKELTAKHGLAAGTAAYNQKMDQRLSEFQRSPLMQQKIQEAIAEAKHAPGAIGMEHGAMNAKYREKIAAKKEDGTPSLHQLARQGIWKNFLKEHLAACVDELEKTETLPRMETVISDDLKAKTQAAYEELRLGNVANRLDQRELSLRQAEADDNPQRSKYKGAVVWYENALEGLERDLAQVTPPKELSNTAEVIEGRESLHKQIANTKANLDRARGDYFQAQLKWAAISGRPLQEGRRLTWDQKDMEKTAKQEAIKLIEAESARLGADLTTKFLRFPEDTFIYGLASDKGLREKIHRFYEKLFEKEGHYLAADYKLPSHYDFNADIDNLVTEKLFSIVRGALKELHVDTRKQMSQVILKEGLTEKTRHSQDLRDEYSKLAGQCLDRFQEKGLKPAELSQESEFSNDDKELVAEALSGFQSSRQKVDKFCEAIQVPPGNDAQLADIPKEIPKGIRTRGVWSADGKLRTLLIIDSETAYQWVIKHPSHAPQYAQLLEDLAPAYPGQAGHPDPRAEAYVKKTCVAASQKRDSDDQALESSLASLLPLGFEWNGQKLVMDKAKLHLLGTNGIALKNVSELKTALQALGKFGGYATDGTDAWQQLVDEIVEKYSNNGMLVPAFEAMGTWVNLHVPHQSAQSRAVGLAPDLLTDMDHAEKYLSFEDPAKVTEKAQKISDALSNALIEHKRLSEDVDGTGKNMLATAADATAPFTRSAMVAPGVIPRTDSVPGPVHGVHSVLKSKGEKLEKNLQQIEALSKELSDLGLVPINFKEQSLDKDGKKTTQESKQVAWALAQVMQNRSMHMMRPNMEMLKEQALENAYANLQMMGEWAATEAALVGLDFLSGGLGAPAHAEIEMAKNAALMARTMDKVSKTARQLMPVAQMLQFANRGAMLGKIVPEAYANAFGGYDHTVGVSSPSALNGAHRQDVTFTALWLAKLLGSRYGIQPGLLEVAGLSGAGYASNMLSGMTSHDAAWEAAAMIPFGLQVNGGLSWAMSRVPMVSTSKRAQEILGVILTAGFYSGLGATMAVIQAEGHGEARDPFTFEKIPNSRWRTAFDSALHSGAMDLFFGFQASKHLPMEVAKRLIIDRGFSYPDVLQIYAGGAKATPEKTREAQQFVGQALQSTTGGELQHLRKDLDSTDPSRKKRAEDVLTLIAQNSGFPVSDEPAHQREGLDLFLRLYDEVKPNYGNNGKYVPVAEMGVQIRDVGRKALLDSGGTLAQMLDNRLFVRGSQQDPQYDPEGYRYFQTDQIVRALKAAQSNSQSPFTARIRELLRQAGEHYGFSGDGLEHFLRTSNLPPDGNLPSAIQQFFATTPESLRAQMMAGTLDPITGKHRYPPEVAAKAWHGFTVADLENLHRGASQPDTTPERKNLHHLYEFLLGDLGVSPATFDRLAPQMVPALANGTGATRTLSSVKGQTRGILERLLKNDISDPNPHVTDVQRAARVDQALRNPVIWQGRGEFIPLRLLDLRPVGAGAHPSDPNVVSRNFLRQMALNRDAHLKPKELTEFVDFVVNHQNGLSDLDTAFRQFKASRP